MRPVLCLGGAAAAFALLPCCVPASILVAAWYARSWRGDPSWPAMPWILATCAALAAGAGLASWDGPTWQANACAAAAAMTGFQLLAGTVGILWRTRAAEAFRRAAGRPAGAHG